MSTLEILLAEREIHRAIVRYCRAADRLDEDLLGSVYHDDGTDDHGIYKGLGKEMGAFMIPMVKQIYRTTMHAVHNCLIEVEGDKAGAETYCVAYHERVDESEQRWLDVFGCRYVDRFECRAGVWAITERVVVHDWDAALPLTADFGEMVATFAPGRRDTSDLSYKALGIPL